MANKAKSTQGSILSVGTATGGPYTKVANATAIPRGTGSAQWLDATNYDSVGTKEYIPALSDVSDITVTGQRVVDDAGQNILRDAYHANPKTTLYFQAVTAQGETFAFTSEVASWGITGDPNTIEVFNAGIRPRDEVYTAPAAAGAGG